VKNLIPLDASEQPKKIQDVNIPLNQPMDIATSMWNNIKAEPALLALNGNEVNLHIRRLLIQVLNVELEHVLGTAVKGRLKVVGDVISIGREREGI